MAEFFSGKGALSRQVRALGFTARGWERLRSEDEDLTSPSAQRAIRQDIGRGKLIAAFLAPPCGTFSMANRAVVRTHEDPWGLWPQSGNNRAKVDGGNACALAAIQLIKDLNKNKIPWILEHPRTSRLFWTPEMKHIMAQANVTVVHCDQCQFGARWRKSTTFVCGDLNPIAVGTLDRRCRSGRSRICTKSHRPHLVLRGTSPYGVPWTSIASTYPPSLCKRLATLLVASARDRIAAC